MTAFRERRFPGIEENAQRAEVEAARDPSKIPFHGNEAKPRRTRRFNPPFQTLLDSVANKAR